jgi:thiol:disulfide interchange protein DsbD
MLIRLLLTLFVLSGFACAEEPLPPEQAFRFSARAVDAKTIEARWQITDQYYMYRDKFKFAAEGGTLGAPKYPPGKMKEDENFGKVEVYRKEVKILIPVEAAGAVTLKAVSQGCWDGGICYPPINQEARVDLAAAGSAVSPAPTLEPRAASGDETSRIAGLFKGDNLALVLASFFGFGLLLSLTPCVFPMIPILSGIIVGARPRGEPCLRAGPSCCRWPMCSAWRSPTPSSASPPGSRARCCRRPCRTSGCSLAFSRGCSLCSGAVDVRLLRIAAAGVQPAAG